MHHHANGRLDWLISEHQSVNPSIEAISILSGKYKRFTFGPLSTEASVEGVSRVISEVTKSRPKGYFSLNDFHAWAACNGQNSKE